MDWHFGATAFATAFTIIDPIGMIPFTVTSTTHFPADRRARIVDQAVLVAAVVMLFMGIVGPAVLDYLGITLPAFGIAGGILLFLISIDMLFARPSGSRATTAEEKEAQARENPAVFPLAIPMIAGPGTLATVMLLVNQGRGSVERYAFVFIAYAVTLVIAWLCMRGAARYMHRIGMTGIHVVSRVLGIILAALAVQFVINGLVQTPLLHH
jgi:multiple antibiotic resistance protein